MSKWQLIHDEELGDSNRTLCVWSAPHESNSMVLFEVNEQGLRHRYYQTAKDAIEGKFHIADACYGYTMLMWEEHESDAWLDRVWAEQDSTEITECVHKGTCEDEFHRAQVVLGNEESYTCFMCGVEEDYDKGIIIDGDGLVCRSCKEES